MPLKGMTIGVIFVALASPSACVTVGQEPLPVTLSREKIKSLDKSVFEVVIPKGKDKVRYEKPLPLERIPYAQRVDDYHGIGTAFAVTGKRLVSAAHVFDLHQFHPGRTYFVRDGEGKVHAVDEILRYSHYRDLVVFTLKTYPKGMRKLTLRRSAVVGDRVYTVGNALGEGISIRGGQVASYTAEPVAGAWEEIRYSAPASPGNSGGPLLNTRGEAIGVVIRKNSSENLNFAVPISELHNMSSRRALFQVRENRMEMFGMEIDGVWEYEPRLPAAIGDLAAKAERRYRKFWIAQWKTLMKEARTERYPHDPDFGRYVKAQDFSVDLKRVTRAGNDGYEAVGGQRVASQGTRKGDLVSWAKISPASDFVYVETAPKTSPEVLWKHPERILDAVIAKQGWNRDVMGSRVPIESYGKPEEEGVFEDRLGRPWLKSVWRTSFDATSVFLNCLPKPRGVACLLFRIPSEQETRGFQEQFEAYHAAEMPLSYAATVPEWQNFLAQPAKLLPKALRGSLIKHVGDRLKVSLGGIEAKFRPKESPADTTLFVGMGYFPEDPSEQKVLYFEVSPGAGPGVRGAGEVRYDRLAH